MDKAIRQLVWERSKGFCEHCSKPLDEEAWDFHHRKLRKHGGKDSPENALALDHHCHLIKVHGHPVESRNKGWIVSSYAEPREQFVLLYDKVKVYLQEDGTYREANDA